MNKTVLGILGFLLLAPGLAVLAMGGIIFGPLFCAVGGGLLVLAIKPEFFKRYFILVTALHIHQYRGPVRLLHIQEDW